MEQNLPPNTVVGRLGSGMPGPAQAITFNTLAAQLGSITGSSSLKWFNVMNYGAIGNGVADDTAAINAAIAAFNAAGIGVLYFPSGTYLATAGLTAITASGLVRGDGSTLFPVSSVNPTGWIGATTINCSSATAVLFTVNTINQLVFIDLTIACTAATPTAGAGIQVSPTAAGGQNISYERTAVVHFYIGIDVQSGQAWLMNHCWLQDCVLYYVKVRNIPNPDEGDWFISNCYFNLSAIGIDNAIGLRIESSGGAKIVNCKFVGHDATHGFDKCIDLEGAGNTVDFLCTNCSFEDWHNRAILLNGSWPQVVITNIQAKAFAAGASGAVCIDIEGNNDVAVSNCVLDCGVAGPSCIKIVNCNRVAINNIVSFNGTTAAVDISTTVVNVSAYNILTNTATCILTSGGNSYSGFSDFAINSGFAINGLFNALGLSSSYAFHDQTLGNAVSAWQMYANNHLARFWAQDASGGHEVFSLSSTSVLEARSGGAFAFSSGATDPTLSPDTSFSRSAAGVVALGNGTPGDGSATILAKTKAGVPTTGDVPAGTWALIRDTTNSTTKLYYNNAGALQSVALA